jgi:hypothetical protein
MRLRTPLTSSLESPEIKRPACNEEDRCGEALPDHKPRPAANL